MQTMKPRTMWPPHAEKVVCGGGVGVVRVCGCVCVVVWCSVCVVWGQVREGGRVKVWCVRGVSVG